MASTGFSISITAKDATAGPLEAINKRLARLQAPADRFNKAMNRFGDVSGLARVTESVRSLGEGAADAFRSLDRMASPLAAITSVGSIAGIAALTRRWAEFGNSLGLVSYRLNTPVEKLGELRGAMRLAGGNAADLDAGMRGLGDTINAAAWGRDSGAMQMFNALEISTRDANGNIRQTIDVLGDVAEKIQGLPAVTQSRILAALGMGDGFLPLLKNGRKGLEEFEKQAKQTGGVMSGEMVQHASEMNQAFQRLGMDFEGVGNRIVDSWSDTVTKALKASSHLIEKNHDIVDSITQIGAAFSALGGAGWLAKLLGFGATSGAIGTVTTLGAPLTLGGDTPSNPLLNVPADPNAPGFFGQGGTLERWMHGNFRGPRPMVQTYGASDADFSRQRLTAPQTTGSSAPSSGGGATGWWREHAPSWAPGAAPAGSDAPRGIRNNNPLNLSYVPGQGAVRSDGRFGVYSTMQEGIAASERQLLKYQDERGLKTLRQMISRWAPDNENNTAAYIKSVSNSTGFDPDSPVNMHDPAAASKVLLAMSKVETGRNLDPDVVDQGVRMGLGLPGAQMA